MNTETTPAAGNVSVRQLATTLTKTAPAPGEKKEPAAPAATEATQSESTREREAETEAAAESLKTVETTESETEQRPNGETAETDNTEEAAAGKDETPTETADETTEETAKAGLPPEVLEAMEIAKAQDGGKGKAEMLKRIHKLTDARDTERNARLQAEEQAKNLRAELQQAREGKPTAAMPAGGHPEVAKVSQELATVDHWLGWCEEQLPRLQSGEVETVEAPDGKGGKLQVGLKDVAKTKRDLENMRQEVVARKVQVEQAVKAAFDTAYETSHKLAVEKFPFLKDPNSDQAKRAQQFISMVPGLKQFPDHELVVGAFFNWLDSEGKVKAAPAPVRRAAPPREPTRVSTTPPGGGAEPVPEGEKKVKESRQQFTKSGSTRDLAKTLTASRQVSRTTKR